MEKKTSPLIVYTASKIEERRSEIEMTQEDLAFKTGLSRSSIINMEHGRQSISIERLFSIAEVLEIEPRDLLPNMAWYKDNKGKKLRKVISFEIVKE